jgi:LacI family transcriptional regulator
MSLPEPPDAIFVHNNVMTQGAVLALQDLGLQWPDDLDIAGFGAFSQARLYRPPLTLISQPTHAMGACAVDLLVALLEHPRSQEVETIVLPCRVVSRAEWRDAHQTLKAEGTLQPI